MAAKSRKRRPLWDRVKREFFDCENPCENYPEYCDNCPHRPWCYIYRVNQPMELKPK